MNLWISVADRLPEPDEVVIATNGRMVGEAYIDKTENCWMVFLGVDDFEWDRAYSRPVTHWMPLPEPPEV